MQKYFVTFVTNHLYYLPQFLPIARELKKRGKTCLFFLHDKDRPEQITITKAILTEEGFDYLSVNDYTNQVSCKFLICGANGFPESAPEYDYSALVVHGIGTKAGYFTENMNVYDIRFVEGNFRLNKIKELFPDAKPQLHNVGFSKLDDAVNLTPEDKAALMAKYGLDPEKKTILYAPTFYPSSIEKMPVDFPKDFADYNIIIKPHFFSFLLNRYKHQRKIFEKWDIYPQVYFALVEDYNLVPFMAIADVMISDESSAIFEFAALNKPVICNRNVHYRLTYRIFKSKIRKRMDATMDEFRMIASSAYSYKELVDLVKQEVQQPQKNEANRLKLREEIVGKVDGKVSVRIADILENFKK